MKVCFLGAGALGSSIGGTLTHSGAEVYLIDRWQEHINAIQKKGLILHSGGEQNKTETVNIHAVTDATSLDEMDLVIVLVKSFATRDALESAKSLIGKHTMVLSLQNGLGNEDVIADVIGKEHVIGGRTYVGGVLLKPGQVIATTRKKLTRIGELNGQNSDRIQTVKNLFEQAGMDIEITTNIVGEMWDKLLVNVATGALSSLTQLTYGDLYSMPELEDVACMAVAEGIAVALAEGVQLSSIDPMDAWLKASAGLPKEFKTSMLQSIEKEKPTEIDFINGAVVRYGQKNQILTPVNKTLVACIKGLEKTVLKRSKKIG